MKITSLHAVSVDVVDVKSIGDEVIVDGAKYTIKEVNSHFDEYANVHSINYTLDQVIVAEPTMEELQEL